MSTKKAISTKRRREMATSTKKTAEDYLKKPYARILIPGEDGQFSAEVLEFPGCYAQGENAGEAFANLEKAAAAWIEVCLDQGQEIPPPSSNQGYSGKVALRMPRDLHRAAIHKAARDGVSLNHCLVTAIAAWIGADNLFERIAHKIEMNFVQANFISITPFSGTMPSWFLPCNAAAVIPHRDLQYSEMKTIGGSSNG